MGESRNRRYPHFVRVSLIWSTAAIAGKHRFYVKSIKRVSKLYAQHSAFGEEGRRSVMTVKKWDQVLLRYHNRFSNKAPHWFADIEHIAEPGYILEGIPHYRQDRA